MFIYQKIIKSLTDGHISVADAHSRESRLCYSQVSCWPAIWGKYWHSHSI